MEELMRRRRRGSSIFIWLYLLFLLLVFILPAIIISCGRHKEAEVPTATPDISYNTLNDSYKYSLATGFSWVDLMSYASAARKKSDEAPASIQQIVNLLSDNNYKYDRGVFNKNRQFYSILLDDIIGPYSYERQKSSGLNGTAGSAPVSANGIRLFYPIPSGFKYTHNDDFGAPRSYAGITKHEGNDIMAEAGTPVIAIESGYVEKIGWNNAGGYRISIRSSNGKRLYYYAHFSGYSDATKQLVPAKGSDPTEKKYIEAGTVIGYVGSTGSSTVPGTSGLFPSHLHVQIGLALKKNETTWINPYGFIKFIENNAIKQSMDNFIIIKTK